MAHEVIDSDKPKNVLIYTQLKITGQPFIRNSNIIIDHQ